MTPPKIKVFLVDDHPGTREGLRKLLEFENDMCVCGEAGSVVEAVTGITKSQPALVVVDLELGKESGIQLTTRLRELQLKVPVMILSMHPEAVYAEDCLQKGAAGYLMKSETPEQILLGLREVLQGRIYLSPAMRTKRDRPI